MPRPSPVSDAVRNVFEGHARHAWSLDQLHETVQGVLGGADYSTVFRAVAAMEREGVIRRIDLGDGKAYATSGVQNSTGFVVTSHHLVFSGLCPNCSRAKTPD